MDFMFEKGSIISAHLVGQLSSFVCERKRSDPDKRFFFVYSPVGDFIHELRGNGLLAKGLFSLAHYMNCNEPERRMDLYNRALSVAVIHQWLLFLSYISRLWRIRNKV